MVIFNYFYSLILVKMKINDILLEASELLNINSNTINKVYRMYWKVIKDYIQSLKLKRDLSEEEFNNIQSSINIPSLGKLYTTYDKVSIFRKHYKRQTHHD